MSNCLLSIGFGRFKRSNDFCALSSAQNNHLIISEVLSGGSRPVVAPDKVCEPLFDATTAEIRPALDQFFSEAEAGDDLFLYITGHGVISNKATDLFVPTENAHLKAVKEKDHLDPSTCLSIKADIAGRRTKAATVNVILDCCQAGALNSVISEGSTAKDAAGVHFEDSTGLIENIDGAEKSTAKYTYFLASDADGSAFDLNVSFDMWQAGLHADRLRQVGINENQKVSSFMLSLFRVSEASKVLQLPPAHLDSAAAGEKTILLEAVKQLRDIDMQINESDDGLVNLCEVGTAVSNLMESADPPQRAALLDAHSAASTVPVFYKSTASRSGKIAEIGRFIDEQPDLLTVATRRQLDSFLLDAKNVTKNERSEVDLWLEDQLFISVDEKDRAKFTEVFILRDHEIKLRSEVSAAIKRRLEKSDRIGVQLSESLDSSELNVLSLKSDVSSLKTDLSTTKSKLDVWRRVALFSLILCFMGLVAFVLGLASNRIQMPVGI